MQNFWRALRFAWPYRRRLILSVLCAMVVGLLWAANISAVYPVVKVLFGGNGGKGGNLQQWVQEKLDGTEQDLRQKRKELAPLLEQADDPEIRLQADRLHAAIRSAERAREWYAWLQPIVVRWVPSDPFQTLVWLLALVMLGIAVKGVFFFLQEALVGSVTQLSLFDLRNRFYRKALHLDLASFNQEGTSELMARFTYDMESLANGIATLFGKMIREPLKALSCLAAACYISWQLTLLSVLLAPVAGLIILRIGRLMKRAARRTMESMARIYKILEESFAGIKIVKAFTMERYERRRFFTAAKHYYHKAMRIVMLEALESPLTELMGMGVIAVALLAGAYLVLSPNGEMSLFGIRMADRPLDTSSLVVLYAMLAGISDPARKLSNVYNRIQRATAAADRIFALMDRTPAVVDAAKGSSVVRHRRLLEMENVGFQYRPGQPVLQDINLRISFGQCVALVGPNGCGKTTLANLILRFYDPTSGQIRIDGTDLSDIPLRELRRQIGIVTQETVLFDDTVYNNIAYGCRSAPAEAVYEAAERAYAHRFIEQLPQGYETVVGEKGRLLSGGQQQRIALARAILRDPAILILDEATSALDLESEHLIHQALEQFIRNRTAIVITHRLSTLALAQRIVVMEAGRICAIGTHRELLASSSLYRRLHELDFQRETA